MDKEPLKIMIIEDNPGDVDLIKEMLSSDKDFTYFTLEETARLSEALARLERERFDLILLDLNLPDSSGLDTFTGVHAAFPAIPIIVLTGDLEEETAISAMGQGAQDYLVKGQTSGGMLVRAIRYSVERSKAEEALRESEERFRRLTENAQDLIWRLRLCPERCFEYVSPAAKDITGYSPEEFYADPDMDFKLVHPEYFPVLEAAFGGEAAGAAGAIGAAGAVEAAGVTEAAFEHLLTLRWVRKDGEVIWVEQRNVPIYDRSGKLVAVESITRDITARKNMEDNIRQRLAELESLYTISSALRSAETMEKMLPLLLEETLEVLNTEAGAICLYYPSSGELRFSAARGWFCHLEGTLLRPGEGIAGTVFSTGKPYISREFASDPLIKYPQDVPENWGGVCLPIRSAEGTVGVLFVSVPLPREISEGELKLLTSLAEMAGTATHRLSLLEDTVRHLQQLQTLRTVDQAINASLDLRLTLDVLLEHVTARLGVDAAGVFLLNPHLKVLEYSAGRGFNTKTIERMILRPGEMAIGKAALERRTVIVPDCARVQEQKCLQLNKAEGFGCCIGVPLIAKGEVKGVLGIFQRQPYSPEAEWIGFLETLAGQAAIAVDNARLFNDLQQANLGLVMAYDATIEGWSRALDLRDRETEGHTRRVTEMTIELAGAMGVAEKDLIHVYRGSLLHDIGKMGVPDAILHKPGKLTDEEWEAMRRHPQLAYDMLNPIEYLRPALNIPYCHHEKWDGSGYPRGLKGEEIPLEARIFAVADVYDALTSDRPYRQAWTREQALDYIRRESGRHFDPKVVELFLKKMETGID